MSAPTINYFAYGSNMDAASLAAKGSVRGAARPQSAEGCPYRDNRLMPPG